MNFFKNKHIVVAMIVAPVLAIASYYLVDLMVAEVPQAAQAGSAYPLIAKSNCRFSSGRCDLVNGDFKASVTIDGDAPHRFFKLTSNYPLQSATVGFILANGVESEPDSLSVEGKDGDVWTTTLDHDVNTESTMRIVLRANDVQYFAESKMSFSTYKTSFDKDFRRHNSE